MVRLELTPQQTDALLALMDAGVRAQGLQAAPSAAALLTLIQAAAEVAKAEEQAAQKAAIDQAAQSEPT